MDAVRVGPGPGRIAKRERNRSRFRVLAVKRAFALLSEDDRRLYTMSQIAVWLGGQLQAGGVTANFLVILSMFEEAAAGNVQAASLLREMQEGAAKLQIEHRFDLSALSDDELINLAAIRAKLTPNSGGDRSGAAPKGTEGSG